MTCERITLIGRNSTTPAQLSLWQRERATGELLPMVDEHGRPWTFRRLAANLACCCIVGVPILLLLVLG